LIEALRVEIKPRSFSVLFTSTEMRLELA
jgi:hypothetical protein